MLPASVTQSRVAHPATIGTPENSRDKLDKTWQLPPLRRSLAANRWGILHPVNGYHKS